MKSLQVGNKLLNVTGTVIKKARISDEWYEDLKDPESTITTLKRAKDKPDIFTFWQRLPETTPKYNFYMEREAISALPIISFDHWWQKKISSPTRNKIRKAEKKGVVVKVVDFNDDLVKGIMSIFNETPIRRGKPFWHYGKDFDTVKQEWSRDSDRSAFIGAYYNDELIGYVKLIYGGTLAQQVQNLSKIAYRNKYPNNALMAKAVEVCDKKKVPYLTYGGWRRGSHAAFLRRHGFEKYLLPRYYVPITFKGKIAIKLSFHHGVRGILPNSLVERLISLRAKWYSKRYVRA